MHTIKKFILSFAYAGKGILSLFTTGRNMRVHALAAAVVIAAGLFFNITRMEWCIVALCIGLVMSAEAFNTALEMLTDIVKPERHPAAGKLKDIAAGGVLLAAAAAAAAGLLIFGKYFSGHS